MESLSDEAREIVETELELCARLTNALERRSLAGGHPPYFAHLALTTDGRRWDLLVGFQALVDTRHQITLVDWRSSRLAAVFFRHEEGDTYEVRVDGRRGRGQVLGKRLVEFRDGRLTRIETPRLALARDSDSDSAWQVVARLSGPRLLDGALPMTTRERTPATMAQVLDRLDEAQRAVLAHPPAVPLVVVGAAGCGKTTVALHRLARLNRADHARFPQRNLLVVVPEPGLAELASTVLRELGLGRVAVATFDAWIARQARRVFSDLPRRECEDPPAAIVAVKRHPALRAALPALVARLGEAAVARLDRALAGRGRLGAAWSTVAAPTLRAQLDGLEAQLLAAAPASLDAEIRQAFAAEHARLYRVRDDLLELFGDRELLLAVVAGSEGDLTPGMVAEVLEHTHQQFSRTSDEQFADVEAELKRTVDGRGLDEGTPQEAAKTVDREDYAVCFELLRLKTGGLATAHGQLGTKAAIVVDEAQDFAAIEMALLGRALAAGGSLMVCGDRWQQIDPTARFAGWDRTLTELGAGSFSTIHLQTSYRLSEPVTRFAHAVLGPLAPALPPAAGHAGPPVLESTFETEAHAAHFIGEALVELWQRQPAATIAVIARRPETARRLFEALPWGLGARLVLSGQFKRAPGVDVTTVAQVKGLEFDVVIVPDRAAYGDDPDARRNLYVACTRALAQLWVVGT